MADVEEDTVMRSPPPADAEERRDAKDAPDDDKIPEKEPKTVSPDETKNDNNDNNPRPTPPISRLSATELREKVLREKLKAMRRTTNSSSEKPPAGAKATANTDEEEEEGKK
ncbi:hypothetical protein VTN02DRAFT_4273 [Thermoascus thermophilus]